MTLAEELSFARLCHEELSRVKVREGIGLLEEKRLHSVCKRWLSDDFATHEQKITGNGEKKRRFVADVLMPDGQIFEVQTGKLFPLRKKLEFYFQETAHPVCILHPLIAKKHVSWMDPETGELKKRSRSPKRERPLHGIAQLKPFLPYLEAPRFSLILPEIEAEEFRLLDGWGREKRRGSHRFELIPTKLLEVYRFTCAADYLAQFPADAPAQFTAKEFGKLTHLRGYALYDALAVFEGLGAIEKHGTRGRATVWERKI